MQKYLKDILSDPPHGLGTVANILLLFSAVLLVSIFFIEPEEQDVTLNLLLGQPAIEIAESQKQIAEASYAKLYPLVQKGQIVEEGDTLFSALSAADLKIINTWSDLLAKGKLLPTKEMIDMHFVDATVRKKMIDLARVKSPPRKVDKNRLRQLKKDVSRRSKSVEEYKQAIQKFKGLDGKYKKEFSQAKEEYEDGLLSLADLKKAKRKEEENNSIILQRERELESEKLRLFNAKSEFEFLNKSKATTSKIIKDSDNTFHEADLRYALDSLIQSSLVFAAYNGELEEIGSLDNVVKGDILVAYAAEEIQSHRSKKLIAIVKPEDASRIILGRELDIYRKDGYPIKGKVKEISTLAEGKFEIESSEELSDMDVQEIILPAKKGNFIEKVLENF